MKNTDLTKMLKMIKAAKSVYVSAITGREYTDPVYVEVKKTCLRNCIKAESEKWDLFWFDLAEVDGNKYLFIN